MREKQFRNKGVGPSVAHYLSKIDITTQSSHIEKNAILCKLAGKPKIKEMLNVSVSISAVANTILNFAVITLKRIKPDY